MPLPPASVLVPGIKNSSRHSPAHLISPRRRHVIRAGFDIDPAAARAGTRAGRTVAFFFSLPLLTLDWTCLFVLLCNTMSCYLNQTYSHFFIYSHLAAVRHAASPGLLLLLLPVPAASLCPQVSVPEVDLPPFFSSTDIRKRGLDISCSLLPTHTLSPAQSPSQIIALRPDIPRHLQPLPILLMP